MSARVDDLLRDLRVELDTVTPSVGFRQRLRAFALTRGRRRGSRTAMTTTLAVAAALLLAGRSFLPAPDVGVVAELPRVAAVAQAEAASRPIASVPRPAQTVSTSRAAARVASVPGVQPEVLVPRDQELAVRQWLGFLRSPRDVEVAATAAVPAIAPVEIPLIQINPVSAGHPGGERHR